MKLKLINLNLFEGGLLFERAFDFIDSYRPDLICLQEIFDGQTPNLPSNLRTTQLLHQHFSDYHLFFSPEFIAIRDEGKIPIGNAILSKFPFITQSTIELSQPFGEYLSPPADKDWSHHPKNMQQVHLVIGGLSLDLFNLHGIWGLGGDDTPARLKMSQIIIDQIQDMENVILSGDFNVKPNTQTIANIEQHLTNVFKDELTTTFNMKRKTNPGYATAVVDMVFASPHIQIISKSCPQVDISDHLPLVVEFDLQ